MGLFCRFLPQICACFPICVICVNQRQGLAFGSWLLVLGSWLLALFWPIANCFFSANGCFSDQCHQRKSVVRSGSWPLALGLWLLAFGSWFLVFWPIANCQLLFANCFFSADCAVYNAHMNRDAGEILKDALALPSETRAALADSLWESLDHEVDAEEAWRKEIHRRLGELDSGAVKAIPWSEARARLLAKLPE
jgi:putative addiction module component (TIGR02574 family)